MGRVGCALDNAAAASFLFTLEHELLPGSPSPPAAAEAVLDREFALILVQPEPVVMPRSRWLEVLNDYVVHEWGVEEQLLADDGERLCCPAATGPGARHRPR